MLKSINYSLENLNKTDKILSHATRQYVSNNLTCKHIILINPMKKNEVLNGSVFNYNSY
jgi:hypothetical protein